MLNPLIEQYDHEVGDSNGDDGRHEARQLEGMVDDKLANVGTARAVELKGCYLRRIVRQEKITVDGWEHGNQQQRVDT